MPSARRPPLMGDRLDPAAAARFGILVALSAIFVDAAVAHGLYWENDPYWTYWVTKTFLIATVFTLGTVFLGVGLGPGLVLTLVHTLILEVYYQWMAPIGLPQEPQWLPVRDLWTLGFVTHFLAILGGYLLALWIWRRRANVATLTDRDAPLVGLFALGAAVLAVVVDGVVTQAVLLGHFPGIAFFVQRLLIAFVFLFAWSVYVGYDRAGLASGAVLLALVWTTYAMYLGPASGPSDLPFVTGQPPLTKTTYLDYEELWLRTLPGGVAAVLAALVIATRVVPGPLRRVAAPVRP
jgi:hypothetical protein